MTLQNISKHKLSYNPISYALWYEYATGRNELLNRDIDSLVKSKKPFSDDVVNKLFKKHMAERQVLQAEKATREFQKILAEMTQHLSESGSQLSAQGNSLEDYEKRLLETSSMDVITGIAKNIVSETKSIVESGKSLKKQVDSTASEIEDLRKELEGIKQTAKTDMLTKLLNRHGFDEAMAEILKSTQATGTPFCVVMVDIDHFKRVNDTFGHLIGDNVLKMLSKLLKEYIKGKDIAARFGGEEFILVLPETPLKGAFVLAEQIRLSLKKMIWKTKDTGKTIGPITISLGIAQYKGGEPLDDTIKRADDALYQAKNSGRNQTVTENEMEGLRN